MIPHVQPRKRVLASQQNALIDQVNQNTQAIENLSAPGGDLTVVAEMIEEAVTEHSEAASPHKAYDLDIPSLTLIFENGLV